MQSMWDKKFGDDYVNRNLHGVEERNTDYFEKYGITRTRMNSMFLPKVSKILEVGCNIGTQMEIVKQKGDYEIYGCDINDKALEMADEKGLFVVKADAENLPFKDGEFDLVYTSGLLIHIPLDKLRKVIYDIIRCSKRYVWGYEYYACERTMISYRGFDDLLWTDDYSGWYEFMGLRLVKEMRWKLLYEHELSNEDSMFLMEKING